MDFKKPTKFITQNDIKIRDRIRKGVKRRYEKWKKEVYPKILREKFKNQKIYNSLRSGYRAELLALNLIDEATRNWRGVDLEWKGLQIEIKTARINRNVVCSVSWNFTLGKDNFYKTDLFLFFCKDDIDKLTDIYLIPRVNLEYHAGITIGKESREKFEKYKINIKNAKSDIKNRLENYLKSTKYDTSQVDYGADQG